MHEYYVFFTIFRLATLYSLELLVGDGWADNRGYSCTYTGMSVFNMHVCFAYGPLLLLSVFLRLLCVSTLSIGYIACRVPAALGVRVFRRP